MGSQSGKSISGWKAINRTIVYYVDDYAKFLADKKAYEKELEAYYNGNDIESIETKEPPSPPEIQEPLNGLRIMSVSVKERATTTKTPVESGVRISDNKVQMPRTIRITGICDNLRGELITTKDTRSKVDTGIPIVGGAINNVINGVVDTVMGYEYETKQEIKILARRVYENIDKMYREKTSIDVNGVKRPKTYTISTKGMVYSNMILVDVEQLNDSEHLLTIPVTLVFEELIMLGEKSAFPNEEQDGDLSMGGSIKKGNIIDETVDMIKAAFD